MSAEPEGVRAAPALRRELGPGPLLHLLYQRLHVQLDKLQDAPDREACGRQSRRPNPSRRGRPSQPPPRVSSAPESLVEPTEPSGDERSSRSSAAARLRPAENHSASLRAEPPLPSSRRIATTLRGPAQPGFGARARERLSRPAFSPRARPAAQSAPPPPSCGDVGADRRRLREGGFSADPGRWFRW